MYITSIILRIASFIIIAIGLYYGGYEGLLEPMQTGHRFQIEDKIQLGAGFALIFLGVLGLTVSQIADAILSKNTFCEGSSTPNPKPIEKERIYTSTKTIICPKCNKTYDSKLSGDFCEDCGASLKP